MAAYTCDPDGLITYFNRQVSGNSRGRATSSMTPWTASAGRSNCFPPNGARAPPRRVLDGPVRFGPAKSRVARRSRSSARTARASPSSPTPTRCTTSPEQLLGAANILVDLTQRQRHGAGVAGERGEATGDRPGDPGMREAGLRRRHPPRDEPGRALHDRGGERPGGPGTVRLRRGRARVPGAFREFNERVCRGEGGTWNSRSSASAARVAGWRRRGPPPRRRRPPHPPGRDAGRHRAKADGRGPADQRGAPPPARRQLALRLHLSDRPRGRRVPPLLVHQRGRGGALRGDAGRGDRRPDEPLRPHPRGGSAPRAGRGRGLPPGSEAVRLPVPRAESRRAGPVAALPIGPEAPRRRRIGLGRRRGRHHRAGGDGAGVREADRRKDEFLAMLAHELRNPLAVHLQRRPGREAERRARAPRVEPGGRRESAHEPLPADRRPARRLPDHRGQDPARKDGQRHPHPGARPRVREAAGRGAASRARPRSTTACGSRPTRRGSSRSR